ncbi:MAG: hypothetical protein ACJ762_21415 [Solirubrobacteraceae bacterium]
MSRSFLAPLLAVLALAALPAAAQARNCPIAPSESGSFGVTYVLKITATGTTCGKAKKLVRAFHACRKAHGIQGRCTKKVLGYSCSEQRTTTTTQMSGKVSCKYGSRRVVHYYSQNI